MDDTYDVLRSFGVPGLPLPFIEVTPNRWFDQLSPAAQPVTAEALRQAGLLPVSHVAMAAAVAKPQAEVPSWRSPGTPEWQQLQEQLLQPTLKRRLAGQTDVPGAP